MFVYLFSVFNTFPFHGLDRPDIMTFITLSNMSMSLVFIDPLETLSTEAPSVA